MTKLKVRELKRKRLKVRGSVLHFCQKINKEKERKDEARWYLVSVRESCS